MQQQGDIKNWAEDALMSMQTETEPDIGYGFFIVHFDNRKKRGRAPVRHCEAWGSMYPGGHVHVDSDLPQREFHGMQELRDYLAQFGHYDIEWQHVQGGVA